MIADGEGPAAEGVQLLAERPAAGPPAARLCAGAIEVDRLIDLQMAVLADDPDADAPSRAASAAARRRRRARRPASASRSRRAESLRLVVQMRQVDERQVGRPSAASSTSAAQRAIHSRARQSPPSVPRRCETGSGPSCFFRHRVPGLGVGEDVERLVAVGAVVRLGRDADVDGGAPG